MTEETIHESEGFRSREAVADYLREVADALEGGGPVPVDDGGEVTVDPPATVGFEVELELEDGDYDLEYELEWSADAEAAASRAGVELYVDSADEYRWRLRHDNGNIIADGAVGYEGREAAEAALRRVRETAPEAPVVGSGGADGNADADDGEAAFELYEDRAGGWRWRFRHDGDTVADSGQGYASKQKCRQGIRSVKRNVAGAPTEFLE